MTSKAIIKKLIVISIIILIIGAMFGVGVSFMMLKFLTEYNVPAENIVGIGADYSGIIRFIQKRKNDSQ